MFSKGELVTTLYQRMGIVVETKRLFHQQYCKVLFVGEAYPEWWHSDQLHDIET